MCKDNKINVILNYRHKKNSYVVQNIEIFPNPIINYCNIFITVTEESSCSISIFDMSGFFVYKFDQLLSKGYHSNSIDLSDVSAGIYICVISTNNGIETIKIIEE
ncbi:MAG: T9SS type A sorting domain-containing protein [Bacteroidales bacterium]|nr:T9SS type A sorting domain-containing protein [Bacteroidales bacterium]